jgi:hypothetical protein
MATGGGLGSGDYYGGSAGGPGQPAGGGGFPRLGGLFGGGPGGQMQSMRPGGPFGAWPACGCSSLLVVGAGILLVCGGFLKMFGQ